jgi:hypothetical protein
MAFLFLCIYTVLVLFRPQDWLLPPAVARLHLLDIAALGSIFFTFVGMQAGRSATGLSRTPHCWLIAGLFGCVVLSHVAHVYFSGMLMAIEEFGKICLIYFLVVANVHRIWQYRVFAGIIVGIAFLMAVHCILQIALGAGFAGTPPLVVHPGSESEIYRAQFFGIFGDPNDTSLFLVAALPLSLFVLRPLRGSRLLALLYWGALIAGCYCTGSRGGFLALMVMAMVLLMMQFRLRRVFVYCIALFLVALMAAPGRFQLGFLEASASGRVEYWGTANAVFKSSPVFGVGYRMITDYLPQDRATHSSFVQAYADLGLLGYAFWFSLLAMSVLGCWRVAQLVPESSAEEELVFIAKLMVPSLVGFFAASYFLSRSYTLPLYLMLGLAAAIYRRAGEAVGFRTLNWRCWASLERIWVYPVISLASICLIYLNIVLYNLTAGR